MTQAPETPDVEAGSGTRSLPRRVLRGARLGRDHAINLIAGVRRRAPDGLVALTFDDGPHPGSTEAILDVLRELDVRATFFSAGKNALAHPEILRRASAEGHAIGSHSFSHPHPAETSLRELAREYVAGRRAVVSALGHDVRMFRPPHGHLTPASGALLRRIGLRPWLWTVDPEDWRPGVSAESVASVAGDATAGDVVLMHDWVEQPWAPEALNRQATIDALPTIVERVRSRGLEFGTLPAD